MQILIIKYNNLLHKKIKLLRYFFTSFSNTIPCNKIIREKYSKIVFRLCVYFCNENYNYNVCSCVANEASLWKFYWIQMLFSKSLVPNAESDNELSMLLQKIVLKVIRK